MDACKQKINIRDFVIVPLSVFVLHKFFTQLTVVTLQAMTQMMA